MLALFLLAIIAWSVVPYKAWSRGALGSEGFNFGDAFLILVLAGVLIQMPHWRKRSTVWPWIAVLWALLAVSSAKGILEGESLREIGRVARGAGFWIIVPLMLLALPTRDRFQAWLSGMGAIVAIAAGMLVAFSFMPGWIPAGEEVGVFRGESIGGFERVFTLGMWAVYAGSIMALSAFFFRPRGKATAGLFAFLLLVCLSFTFARTFFGGILLAVAVFLFLGERATLGVTAAGALGIALVTYIAGLPGFLLRLARAVSDRAMLFLAETPEYAFQTFFWRLSEYTFFAENMISSPDRLLGVLGRSYSLPDGYSASMPHITYLGVYYGQGILGLLVYAVVLCAFTIRLASHAFRTRGTDLHWVTVGAFATWIALLAAGLSAPVLQYAWGVATLAFTVGISETAAQFLRNPDVSPIHQHHHPVPERGAVHPRHS